MSNSLYKNQIAEETIKSIDFINLILNLIVKQKMVRLSIFFIFFFITLLNIVFCVDNAQNSTFNANEYTFNANQPSSGRLQKLEYGTNSDGSLQFSFFNDLGRQNETSNTRGIRNRLRLRQIGRLLHISRRLSRENGNRQLTKSIFFGRGRLLR